MVKIANFRFEGDPKSSVEIWEFPKNDYIKVSKLIKGRFPRSLIFPVDAGRDDHGEMTASIFQVEQVLRDELFNLLSSYYYMEKAPDVILTRV